MSTSATHLPDALTDDRAKGVQLEEILEGVVARLGPGSLLPSERQLTDRYHVARMTVRGAVDALIARGLVYRSPGQGTFVAQPRFAQSEALTSFTEDMRRRGLRPGARVLSHDVVAADANTAIQLEIEPGVAVVRFERLRTADNEPMALERAHLPLERFPGLDELDLGNVSLYDELRRRWDTEIHHADQRVYAVIHHDPDAALLSITPGQAGFRFVRLTRDAAGVPIEYVESLYRGDHYEVRAHLHRGAFADAAGTSDTGGS